MNLTSRIAFWIAFVLIIKSTVSAAQSSEPYWSLANAHLSVTTSKDTVTIGECMVATVAFNVADNNKVPLHFQELGQFVARVSANDLSLVTWWSGRSKIGYIEGKPMTIAKDRFTTYEIVQTKICPSTLEEMFFPSLELPINAFKRTQTDTLQRTIYFKSTAFTVPVIPMPGNARVDSTFGFPLCGRYSLSDTLLAGKPIANKVLPYRITIVTNGVSVLDPDFTAANVDVHLVKRTEKDTIIHEQYSSQNIFDYEIIFRNPGTYDFSNVATYHFWDPTRKQSGSIHAKSRFSVGINPDNSPASFSKATPLQPDFIAVDVSESMQTEDVHPYRLQAVRRGIYDFFVRKKPCGIGVIRFGGVAERIAVTSNNPCEPGAVVNALEGTDLPRGTAIGETIVLALKSFHPSSPKRLVIVSDGDNTAGIPISLAVALARRAHVTIYTIGVGSGGLVPFGKDKNERSKLVDNTFSDVTLKAIAEQTGGVYALAKSDKEIAEILANIFR